MVLYNNAEIIIGNKTASKNTEGTKITTYDYTVNPKVVFIADVQPATLTETEIQLYGIDSQKGNAKKIFYKADVVINFGDRAKVGNDVYIVKGINIWRNHAEAILVPIENE